MTKLKLGSKVRAKVVVPPYAVNGKTLLSERTVERDGTLIARTPRDEYVVDFGPASNIRSATVKPEALTLLADAIERRPDPDDDL